MQNSRYDPKYYRDSVNYSEDAMQSSSRRNPPRPYTSEERRWEAENPIFHFDKSKIGSKAEVK